MFDKSKCQLQDEVFVKSSLAQWTSHQEQKTRQGIRFLGKS
jgi:hypothetical protein